MNVTKAIIPVAGRGTRWLPLTKAIEKCMLPVGNRPIIDYVVQECLAAGIKDFYFIVSEDSSQLRSYYRPNLDLEDYLKRNGREELIDLIETPEARFHFIVQPSYGKYGTAIPVDLALPYIDEGESVLVYMGDNYLLENGGESAVSKLLRSTPDGHSGIIGLVVGDNPDIPRYGFIETNEDSELIRLTDYPEIEPEDFIKNVSIYLFSYPLLRAIHNYVREDRPEADKSEYQIVEPFEQAVRDGNIMHVIRSHGTYLDAGTPDSWLKANQFIFNQSKK